MDPERWHRVTEIFHATLNRTPSEQAAFLDGACASDATLRADVEGLLAGDARAQQVSDPIFAAPAAIAPGTELGPYRIESLLGAGGMGEVYKARDTRLNRSVAIKVLPSAFANDAELRQRFEREAQAIAALRHPHICVLYDIGHDQGVEFLVMEHLEGETLEQRLKKGPLPLDRAMQYAIEIADALHSAHRAGITHRDLKPGNIMLTKDGAGSTSSPQAKLLDFGLAKFGARARALSPATFLPTTPHVLTGEGTIVGTFQYMAPEQLEGKHADERTDLFAFGAVVYEMVTGRTAFIGDSRSNLIASILRDEPAPMATIQPVTPPALDLLVHTCLAKAPDARLQSAHDVAQHLRWIRDGVFQGPDARVTSRGRRPWAWIAALAMAGVVASAGTYLAGRRSTLTVQPTLRQLTFRRGFIDSARFAPDGQTVVYSAVWDGKPRQIFSMRLDTGESLPLPLPAGTVSSISRTGELAFFSTVDATGNETATLAHVPLGGSGVRELVDHAFGANYALDGSTLAVLREDRPGHSWLEYPLGTVVREWSNTRVSEPRISPDGSIVAVKEHDTTGGGWLTFVDRAGATTRMSSHFSATADGAVWARHGDEVWFSASETGLNFSIYGLSRNGSERVVHRTLGSESIQDLAADGRALILHERIRAGMVALAPGEQHERDLSWYDFSRPAGLSADGRLVTFNESGVGGGPIQSAFIRKTDGSPAIRLAEGGAAAGISPDGSSVLVAVDGHTSLQIVPTGPGQARRLDTGNLTAVGQFAEWTADSTSVVFVASEPGRPRRIFAVSVAGGSPWPITPEGVSGRNFIVVSPDSRYVLGRDAQSKLWRYPLGGGTPLPLGGAEPGDEALRWSADGRSIWLLARDRSPARIFQLNVETGRRTLWREIVDADPAGLNPEWLRVLISADGTSYVYGYRRTLSDLYIADGIE